MAGNTGPIPWSKLSTAGSVERILYSRTLNILQCTYYLHSLH